MFNQQALSELKTLLSATFPGEIEQVILYGSQAKGTAVEDSDYDVLIIVNHPYDWRFEHQIYDATWEIDFKYDILTDVKCISTDELQTIKGKLPFVQNAFAEGVIL